MNENQLEDALDAWPMGEVPSGFAVGVLDKIRTREMPASVPQPVKLKFRLTWMDLALGLFLSLLPALAFIAFVSLPRKFVLFLRYQWLVFQFPAYKTLLLTVTLGFSASVFLMFLFSLQFILPKQAMQMKTGK